MSVTLQQLQHWLTSREDEHLEFKEAKNNFHFDKLVKYCAALANEGGGSIVLGVTDKRPRRVVGSNVFNDRSSPTPTVASSSSPRRRARSEYRLRSKARTGCAPAKTSPR
ncbi:MAG: ATP-binding protein [Phycisphaerae bacterium]|nr:ATP-binding protein [Phycisphaerae bacterium]